jgi:hypothetical protein
MNPISTPSDPLPLSQNTNIPPLNPRVIGLILVLIALISAAVITTDILSPRPGKPVPAAPN